MIAGVRPEGIHNEHKPEVSKQGHGHGSGPT